MVCKTKINGKEITFNLDVNKNGFIYESDECRATDGKYLLMGVHNDNPGCYNFLEMVLVYDLETNNYKLVRVWNDIGERPFSEESKLVSIVYEDGNFVVSSKNKKAYIYPNIIMAKDIEKNTIIKPKLDINKMETCFDYEIMDDYAILMTLKEEVPMIQFLKWSGFDMSYNAFKFWGNIIGCGQGHLMFVNTKSENSWIVNYGHSTTLVGDYVWTRKRILLDCIKKIVPTHPQIRETCYTKQF